MAATLPFFQRRIIWKAPPTPISMETSPKHIIESHDYAIRNLVLLQDNVHIVSGSLDGRMRKWNCETGLLVGEPWKGEPLKRAPVYALALSSDGKTIACGRGDGTVERWDTNGQMMEEIWTGHRSWVRSLSWSPSGGDIASGCLDGTILIRNTESGQLKVRPIKTNQSWVLSIAYSPSGDRIASGGRNICIWDGHTGDLLVGPIKGLGETVWSVVWSLDGGKLYSASDEFARVFDSTSGTELHRFQHDDHLNSITLSPIHNVLACVGWNGVAQLWDTESHQPLGHRFQEKNHNFRHVSFSPDGQYLAYGGYDNKITLLSVKVTAPHLLIPGDTQQEIVLKSTSPNVHSTNPLAQSAVDDTIEEIHDDPYNDFFASSQSSLPLPPSPKRRILFPYLFHSARNEPMSFYERVAPRFHSHHALSNPPLHVPAIGERTEPTPKGKCRVRNKDEEHDGLNCPANIAPGTAEQREGYIAHMQTSSPAELDSDESCALLELLMLDRNRGSKMASAEMTQSPSPNVVEVYAARGFKRFIAYKRKPKKKPPPLAVGADTIAAHASGSSQVNSSPHGDALDGGPSSQSMSITGDAVHLTQVNAAIGTVDDSDSDSIIQGGCNAFLHKICFPWGHYKEDG